MLHPKGPLHHHHPRPPLGAASGFILTFSCMMLIQNWSPPPTFCTMPIHLRGALAQLEMAGKGLAKMAPL